MDKLLIHIGYHKTATTWLQKVLFNNDAAGFCMPWNRGQITQDFVKTNSFSFDPSAVLANYELDAAVAERGLTAVLSHERLSGYPASGGFDSKLIADRLNSSLPNAKILIIIREQTSVIRSWYGQYVKDGGGMTLSRFLSISNGNTNTFSRENSRK